MKDQPRETEVKFCVRNLAHIEKRIQPQPPSIPPFSKKKMGGRKGGEFWGRTQGGYKLIQPRTFETNLRFDTSNGDLRRAGRVLRLRKDDLARLTYKDNSKQIKGALTRREIEFVVDDFDSAKGFIEALGYEVVFIYEKYRTTYEYKGTHIMLDELPYGNFVEIEGELEMLRPIAEELGLDWDKAIPVSYHVLFQRVCKSRLLRFRDLTFENFTGAYGTGAGKEIKVLPVDMEIEYADIGKS